LKHLFLLFFILSNLIASNINEKRVALLVANANYDDAPLLHIENDLFNLEIFLKQKNFDVITVEDVTKRETIKALRRFSEKLNDSNIAFFYFAGHSASIDSENYLIPYESSIEERSEIEKESIALFKVIDKMRSSQNRVNIILLDLNVLEYVEIGDDTYKNELDDIKDIERFHYFINFGVKSSNLVADFIKLYSKKSVSTKTSKALSSRYNVHINNKSKFIF